MPNPIFFAKTLLSYDRATKAVELLSFNDRQHPATIPKSTKLGNVQLVPVTVESL